MTPSEFEALVALVKDLVQRNDEAHTEIFKRLDGVNSRQDKINGGIAVLRWLGPLILAAIAIVVSRLR